MNSFFHNEQRVILVGLLDNEIIGYSFLEILNVQLPMMVERNYEYIHDFAISENYRHQGTATKMMEYIELYAISRGVFKIELAVHVFSEDAISLYKKIGFKPRAIRMEKELEL
ncbi:MAG: GNAT family N-acetyltransferase [Clostridium sp.]|nr:GNAT family N-acetyltransferase [Clostridium sp.]